ncbi:hypothetical protein FOCC_FOCC006448 [Frankliniella occidentalis]|nr:hypothetical protein FOCC_FOCC006448 [Frankliniella occidentalis]
MVIVGKKDGKIRCCIDLRKVNQITKVPQYLLPRTETILESMQGKKYGAILDLVWGFHSMVIAPEHRHKTACSVPGVGHVEFNTLLVDEKVCHKSFAIIAEGVVKHDTHAVYINHKILISTLQNDFNLQPKRIIYFTDGAAQHFKNRFNFLNLSNHFQYFGVAAEWHFHATSHVKGPCDGIGGTIKRLATRATLQGPSDKQIISGRHLYDWCVANMQKITVKYVTEMAWVTAKILLRKRFDNAKTVEGTLQYHSFVPCGDYSLEVKQFSFSTKKRIVSTKK